MPSTTYTARPSVTTTYSSRTPVTTSYTARMKPGDFTYYTWDESLVSWDSLTFTWDTWGFGMPATTYTARTPI